MVNKAAVMADAWKRYHARKLPSFDRKAFALALVWAWHDAKKAAADAASDARMAEADRRHRAAWYVKPENCSASIISGREALSYLPAHMSMARAAEQLALNL